MKLLKLTKSDILRKALHYAICWNESFLDSIEGCKGSDYTIERSERLKENEEFKLELKRLLQNSP